MTNDLGTNQETSRLREVFCGIRCNQDEGLADFGSGRSQHAFAGRMPIVREFRAFVYDGEPMCLHPYWPAASLGGRTEDTEWKEKLECLNRYTDDEEQTLRDLAAQAGRVVDGDWSVDLLETKRGWYITDMAQAEHSYHWEQCKRATS